MRGEKARRLARKYLIAALVAALVVAGLGGGWWYWRHRGATIGEANSPPSAVVSPPSGSALAGAKLNSLTPAPAPRIRPPGTTDYSIKGPPTMPVDPIAAVEAAPLAVPGAHQAAAAPPASGLFARLARFGLVPFGLIPLGATLAVIAAALGAFALRRRRIKS